MWVGRSFSWHQLQFAGRVCGRVDWAHAAFINCRFRRARLGTAHTIPELARQLLPVPYASMGSAIKTGRSRRGISKVMIFLHHSGASEESLGRMKSDFFA